MITTSTVSSHPIIPLSIPQAPVRASENYTLASRINSFFGKIKAQISWFLNKKAIRQSAACKIQHAWRCHLRHKLTTSKQTFEKWRVATIVKNRKATYKNELERLKIKKIDPKQRLGWVLPLYLTFKITPQVQTEMEIILGRTLEIKRLYRESHYIFTHAQAHQWAIVAEVMSQLLQKIKPTFDKDLFSFLRMPSDKKTSTTEFLRAHLNIHDHILRKELLSCDAYLWRYEAWESVLFYLSRKDSIKKDISEVVSELISPFFSFWQKGTKNEIVRKINAIAMKRQNECKVGNLFLICIPKKTLQNSQTDIVYRSLRVGVPLKRLPQQDEMKILDAFQDDTSLKSVIKSNISSISTLPQYRMLVEQLRPEDGVRTFSISALSEYKIRKYQQEIQNALSSITVSNETNQASIFEYWQNHIFSFFKSFR